ncbi:hypothetical protein [Rhodovulum steppense]|nr:hypothetical protein [Rhodovulum steppense]
MGESTVALIGGVLVFCLALWLYILLPASMATDRGRSAVGWVCLTLIFSPFLTIIALLVLGPTVETTLARFREEESAKRMHQ